MCSWNIKFKWGLYTTCGMPVPSIDFAISKDFAYCPYCGEEIEEYNSNNKGE